MNPHVRLYVLTTLFWAFSTAAGAHCPTVLWPARLPRGPADFSAALSAPVRDQLLSSAHRQLKHTPAPVAHTGSAGNANLDSIALRESRAAFEDADHAAVLALAWRTTEETQWLAALTDTLLTWSQVHQPSGHPIDETRLDAFLWAYDLARCAIPGEQRTSIDAWLRRMLAAKRQWQFGDKARHNNHRTHQLKLLLALERLIEPKEADAEIARIKGHQYINLAAADGASLDFAERDALHYHVYDLEAWGEIGLLSGCCGPALERSYGFLLKRLRDFPQAVEFANSTAAIDKRRAEAGFAYAQAQPYDPRRAARVTITFATLRSPQVPDQALAQAESSNSKFKNDACRTIFQHERIYPVFGGCGSRLESMKVMR